MLDRKAYDKLVQWKYSLPGKALLVDGPRQVGKTFLIEEFAQREFEDFIKVDFLRDGQASSIAQATDIKDLIDRLSLLHGRRVVSGETLLFFDEVQEAQNLVTLSKYIVEDGRFRLAMSGSLLGVALNRVKSFPVGFLHTETMFPLDFEEFASALGSGNGKSRAVRYLGTYPKLIYRLVIERAVRGERGGKIPVHITLVCF